MRTSDNNGPRQNNRPGFKLGPLPSPNFSQAPTPTSMPMNYTPSSGYPSQSYTIAQQQLQLQQKEIIQQATRGLLPPHMLQSGPISPRLIPLGSPGPVTPLALEDNQGGYMMVKRTEFQFQQSDYDKLGAGQAPLGKQ